MNPLRPEQVTIRGLILLVGISALSMALLVSDYRAYGFILLLPMAGALFALRIGANPVKGGYYGACSLGLGLFVGLALTNRLRAESVLDPIGWLAFILGPVGGIGAAVGLVVDYVAWLLIPQRRARGKGISPSACE